VPFLSHQGHDDGHERVPELLLRATSGVQGDLARQPSEGLTDGNDACGEAGKQRQRTRASNSIAAAHGSVPPCHPGRPLEVARRHEARGRYSRGWNVVRPRSYRGAAGPGGTAGERVSSGLFGVRGLHQARGHQATSGRDRLVLYILLAAAPCLIGIAVVLAVIRAKKDDLPEIVRALMRMEARSDNGADGPPSLPKP